MSMFKPVTKQQLKLRMALMGPSGSGKTYNSIMMARHLAELDGMKNSVCVADTENKSASKICDSFDFGYQHANITAPYSPGKFTEIIDDAFTSKFNSLIVDSWSHFWMGRGGLLDLAEQEAKKMKAYNIWAGFGKIKPITNKFFDDLIRCPVNLICTMRSKQDYDKEKNDKGQIVIRKLGLAPQHKSDIEYEFDVVCELNMEHEIIVSKSRESSIDGMLFRPPYGGIELIDKLHAWLNAGEVIELRTKEQDQEFTKLLTDERGDNKFRDYLREQMKTQTTEEQSQELIERASKALDK